MTPPLWRGPWLLASVCVAATGTLATGKTRQSAYLR
jgi:hypothetical protein